MEFIDDVQECVQKEVEYIKIHPSACNALKNEMIPYRHYLTDVQRKARSDNTKGRIHSNETKIAIGNAHRGKRYQVIKLSDAEITDIILNIIGGSTFKRESSRLNIHYSTLKNIIYSDYVGYDTLKIQSFNNARVLKGLGDRGRSNPKKYDLNDINCILSLYRSGKLISAISPMVNLNSDLVGRLIKLNMEPEELKAIRSFNSKRK